MEYLVGQVRFPGERPLCRTHEEQQPALRAAYYDAMLTT